MNNETPSKGATFSRLHGSSLRSMGWRVKDAQQAFQTAEAQGATPCFEGDYFDAHGDPIPAIYEMGA